MHCCVAALHVAMRQRDANLSQGSGRKPGAGPGAALKGEPVMIFSNAVARIRERAEKRRRFNRLVAEIEGMTERDLGDINGNRGEMLYNVYRDIYG
jgi:hypothetical protein